MISIQIHIAIKWCLLSKNDDQFLIINQQLHLNTDVLVSFDFENEIIFKLALLWNCKKKMISAW